MPLFLSPGVRTRYHVESECVNEGIGPENGNTTIHCGWLEEACLTCYPCTHHHGTVTFQLIQNCICTASGSFCIALFVQHSCDHREVCHLFSSLLASLDFQGNDIATSVCPHMAQNETKGCCKCVASSLC